MRASRGNRPLCSGQCDWVTLWCRGQRFSKYQNLWCMGNYWLQERTRNWNDRKEKCARLTCFGRWNFVPWRHREVYHSLASKDIQYYNFLNLYKSCSSSRNSQFTDASGKLLFLNALFQTFREGINRYGLFFSGLMQIVFSLSLLYNDKIQLFVLCYSASDWYLNNNSTNTISFYIFYSLFATPCWFRAYVDRMSHTTAHNPSQY